MKRAHKIAIAGLAGATAVPVIIGGGGIGIVGSGIAFGFGVFEQMIAGGIAASVAARAVTSPAQNDAPPELRKQIQARYSKLYRDASYLCYVDKVTEDQRLATELARKAQRATQWSHRLSLYQELDAALDLLEDVFSSNSFYQVS